MKESNNNSKPQQLSEQSTPFRDIVGYDYKEGTGGESAGGGKGITLYSREKKVYHDLTANTDNINHVDDDMKKKERQDTSTTNGNKPSGSVSQSFPFKSNKVRMPTAGCGVGGGLNNNNNSNDVHNGEGAKGDTTTTTSGPVCTSSCSKTATQHSGREGVTSTAATTASNTIGERKKEPERHHRVVHKSSSNRNEHFQETTTRAPSNSTSAPGVKKAAPLPSSPNLTALNDDSSWADSLPPDQRSLFRLREVISTLQQYPYNNSGRHTFDIQKKGRDLSSILFEGARVGSQNRQTTPIQCVEGAFLALYLTDDMPYLTRFSISFETASGEALDIVETLQQQQQQQEILNISSKNSDSLSSRRKNKKKSSVGREGKAYTRSDGSGPSSSVRKEMKKEQESATPPTIERKIAKSTASTASPEIKTLTSPDHRNEGNVASSPQRLCEEREGKSKQESTHKTLMVSSSQTMVTCSSGKKEEEKEKEINRREKPASPPLSHARDEEEEEEGVGDLTQTKYDDLQERDDGFGLSSLSTTTTTTSSTGKITTTAATAARFSYLICGDLEKQVNKVKTLKSKPLYRHLVIGIIYRGKFGALGISRNPELMIKWPVFSTLSSMLDSFVNGYRAEGHLLLSVTFGGYIPHGTHPMSCSGGGTTPRVTTPRVSSGTVANASNSPSPGPVVGGTSTKVHPLQSHKSTAGFAIRSKGTLINWDQKVVYVQPYTLHLPFIFLMERYKELLEIRAKAQRGQNNAHSSGSDAAVISHSPSQGEKVSSNTEEEGEGQNSRKLFAFPIQEMQLRERNMKKKEEKEMKKKEEKEMEKRRAEKAKEMEATAIGTTTTTEGGGGKAAISTPKAPRQTTTPTKTKTKTTTTTSNRQWNSSTTIVSSSSSTSTQSGIAKASVDTAKMTTTTTASVVPTKSSASIRSTKTIKTTSTYSCCWSDIKQQSPVQSLSAVKDSALTSSANKDELPVEATLTSTSITTGTTSACTAKKHHDTHVEDSTCGVEKEKEIPSATKSKPMMMRSPPISKGEKVLVPAVGERGKRRDKNNTATGCSNPTKKTTSKKKQKEEKNLESTEGAGVSQHSAVVVVDDINYLKQQRKVAKVKRSLALEAAALKLKQEGEEEGEEGELPVVGTEEEVIRTHQNKDVPGKKKDDLSQRHFHRDPEATACSTSCTGGIDAPLLNNSGSPSTATSTCAHHRACTTCSQVVPLVGKEEEKKPVKEEGKLAGVATSNTGKANQQSTPKSQHQRTEEKEKKESQGAAYTEERLTSAAHADTGTSSSSSSSSTTSSTPTKPSSIKKKKKKKNVVSSPLSSQDLISSPLRSDMTLPPRIAESTGSWKEQVDRYASLLMAKHRAVNSVWYNI